MGGINVKNLPKYLAYNEQQLKPFKKCFNTNGLSFIDTWIRFSDKGKSNIDNLQNMTTDKLFINPDGAYTCHRCKTKFMPGFITTYKHLIGLCNKFQK
jgi:hypothetical protein